MNKFNIKMTFAITHATEKIQNGLLLISNDLTMWDLCNVCVHFGKHSEHILKDVTFLGNILMFVAYIIQLFQSNLTLLSKNLITIYRISVQELKHEYLEHLMRYEYLNKMIFN